MQSKLLAIYLNDHLAGATVGAAVTRRVASSNRESDTERQLEEIEGCRRRAVIDAFLQ
jgi:hypothetical protein